jgi:hypothetical protein
VRERQNLISSNGPSLSTLCELSWLLTTCKQYAVVQLRNEIGIFTKSKISVLKSSRIKRAERQAVATRASNANLFDLSRPVNQNRLEALNQILVLDRTINVRHVLFGQIQHSVTARLIGGFSQRRHELVQLAGKILLDACSGNKTGGAFTDYS